MTLLTSAMPEVLLRAVDAVTGKIIKWLPLLAGRADFPGDASFRDDCHISPTGSAPFSASNSASQTLSSSLFIIVVPLNRETVSKNPLPAGGKSGRSARGVKARPSEFSTTAVKSGAVSFHVDSCQGIFLTHAVRSCLKKITCD